MFKVCLETFLQELQTDNLESSHIKKDVPRAFRILFLENSPDDECTRKVHDAFPLIQDYLTRLKNVGVATTSMDDDNGMIDTKEVDRGLLLIDLERWKTNPSAQGKKKEAAIRILQVFDSNAEELDLSDLNLNQLPACLGSLFLVKDLDLSRNSLEELPAFIMNLGQLISLNLSYNRFEKLHHLIATLSELECLQLQSNPLLRGLPMSLSGLSKLSDLKTFGTQINPAQRNAILRFCQTKRKNTAAEQLHAHLKVLFQHVENQFDLSGIADFTKAEKSEISEWLWHLENAKIFGSTLRTKWTEGVCRMLQDVIRNIQFGKVFLEQITVGNNRLFLELIAANTEDSAEYDKWVELSLNWLLSFWKASKLPEYARLDSTDSRRVALRPQITRILGVENASFLTAEMANIKRQIEDLEIEISSCRELESLKIELKETYNGFREYKTVLLHIYNDTLVAQKLKMLFALEMIANQPEDPFEFAEELYLDYLVHLNAFKKAIVDEKSFQDKWGPIDVKFQDRLKEKNFELDILKIAAESAGTQEELLTCNQKITRCKTAIGEIMFKRDQQLTSTAHNWYQNILSNHVF